RGTLPTLRLSRPAHRVRQQRDQLLRYLPDRRPAAGGSFSFPPVERRLAPPHRRTGMRDCLSNICSIGSAPDASGGVSRVPAEERRSRTTHFSATHLSPATHVASAWPDHRGERPHRHGSDPTGTGVAGSSFVALAGGSPRRQGLAVAAGGLGGGSGAAPFRGGALSRVPSLAPGGGGPHRGCSGGVRRGSVFGSSSGSASAQRPGPGPSYRRG